jgi:hypothetical protein
VSADARGGDQQPWRRLDQPSRQVLIHFHALHLVIPRQEDPDRLADGRRVVHDQNVVKRHA